MIQFKKVISAVKKAVSSEQNRSTWPTKTPLGSMFV